MVVRFEPRRESRRGMAVGITLLRSPTYRDTWALDDRRRSSRRSTPSAVAVRSMTGSLSVPLAPSTP